MTRTPEEPPPEEPPPEEPPPEKVLSGLIVQVLGGLIVAGLVGLFALLFAGDKSRTASPPNAAEAEADITADGKPVLREGRTAGRCPNVVPGALSTGEHNYTHDGIRIAFVQTFYSAVSRTACAKLIKPEGSPYRGIETHLAFTLCGNNNQCDHDWNAYETDAGPVVVPSTEGCISWRVSILDPSGNWVVRDAVHESGCQ